MLGLHFVDGVRPRWRGLVRVELTEHAAAVFAARAEVAAATTDKARQVLEKIGLTIKDFQ